MAAKKSHVKPTKASSKTQNLFDGNKKSHNKSAVKLSGNGSGQATKKAAKKVQKTVKKAAKKVSKAQAKRQYDKAAVKRANERLRKLDTVTHLDTSSPAYNYLERRKNSGKWGKYFQDREDDKVRFLNKTQYEKLSTAEKREFRKLVNDFMYVKNEETGEMDDRLSTTVRGMRELEARRQKGFMDVYEDRIGDENTKTAMALDTVNYSEFWAGYRQAAQETGHDYDSDYALSLLRNYEVAEYNTNKDEYVVDRNKVAQAIRYLSKEEGVVMPFDKITKSTQTNRPTRRD